MELYNEKMFNMRQCLSAIMSSNSKWRNCRDRTVPEVMKEIASGLKDKNCVGQLIEGISDGTLAIRHYWRPPENGCDCAIKCFLKIMFLADLAKFTLTTSNFETVVSVPQDNIGYWSKLALGWISWQTVGRFNLQNAIKIKPIFKIEKIKKPLPIDNEVEPESSK